MTSAVDLYLRGNIDDGLELVEVAFYKDANSEYSIRTARGRYCYLPSVHGNFQWTKAVMAMTLLLLKSRSFGEDEPNKACLEGESGSFASSLDYAISKEPIWLAEMFGVGSTGSSLAKRLFQRVNPERKRPGPVVIRVNGAMLPSSSIRIFVDDSLISAKTELCEVLSSLESPSKELPLTDSLEIEKLTSDSTLRDCLLVIQSNSSSRKLKFEKEGGGVKVQFSSLLEADEFLPSLLDHLTNYSLTRGGLRWTLRHSWWPLIRPLYCFRQGEVVTNIRADVAYVSMGQSKLDREVARFYNGLGVRSRLEVPSISNFDSWLVDDLLLEQRHSHDFQKEVDRYFEIGSKNSERFDAFHFIKEFMEAKGDFSLLIRRDKSVREIKNKIDKAITW